MILYIYISSLRRSSVPCARGMIDPKGAYNVHVQQYIAPFNGRRRVFCPPLIAPAAAAAAAARHIAHSTTTTMHDDAGPRGNSCVI